MDKQSGFTLIEILIALAVLAIAAGGVVVWKFMKNKLSEKILCLITILLILVTVLLSLIFFPKKGILVFLLVFSITYWQRKRLQDFFQKIKNPKVGWLVFVLTAWLWAIFLEFSLELSPFHPKPIANYLIGMGFYLPYFALWLKFIKRYQFTFLEVFYLSGLGRLIFDLLITRKLLIAPSVATSLVSALLIFTSQTIFMLVLFGMLTTLPALYLKVQENNQHNKPVKEYFIGLTSNLLAAGVFILWTIVLKVIFS